MDYTKVADEILSFWKENKIFEQSVKSRKNARAFIFYEGHAQDAVGSTFAPNLLDRIRDFDFDMFVDRTANGFTGQVGVMPPWKDNPNVSKRYKELYAYLKARSSGDLPPGRPKKKPKSN